MASDETAETRNRASESGGNAVISVIGPDRPGLVESVAKLVEATGGNWLESRMARLGGQFAGIVRVSVPVELLDRLESDLVKLKSFGLRSQLVRSIAVANTEPSKEGEMVRLEVVGQDRPGVVRQVSEVLAAHAVNVEELSSRCESAPMSGEILFRAEAILKLPADADRDALQTALEEIGNDLLVDIELREAE